MDEVPSHEVSNANITVEFETLREELQFTVDIAKEQIKFFQLLWQETNELVHINAGTRINIYKSYLVKVYDAIKSCDIVKLSELRSFKSISTVTQLIWRVHMLNPQCYRDDCLKAFGMVIPFIIDEKQNLSLISDENQNPNPNPNVNSFVKFEPSMDLEKAVERQKDFIKKILNVFKIEENNITLDARLNNAFLRYCAFLNLKKTMMDDGISSTSIINTNDTINDNNNNTNKNINSNNNNESSFWLVPRIDIDLLWHSHQLNPINYHLISKRLFNIDIFNHNDNILMRTLINDAKKTRKLWNDTYNNDNNDNDEYKHLNLPKCIQKYTNDAFIYPKESISRNKYIKVKNKYKTAKKKRQQVMISKKKKLEREEQLKKQREKEKESQKNSKKKVKSESEELRDIALLCCCITCGILGCFGLFVGFGLTSNILFIVGILGCVILTVSTVYCCVADDPLDPCKKTGNINNNINNNNNSTRTDNDYFEDKENNELERNINKKNVGIEVSLSNTLSDSLFSYDAYEIDIDSGGIDGDNGTTATMFSLDMGDSADADGADGAGGDAGGDAGDGGGDRGGDGGDGGCGGGCGGGGCGGCGG